MAWKNVAIDGLQTSLVISDIDTFFNYQPYKERTTDTSSFVDSAWSDVEYHESWNPQDLKSMANGTYIIGDAQAGLRKDSNSVWLYLDGARFGEQAVGNANGVSYSSYKQFFSQSIICGVDEDRKLGSIVCYQHSWNGYWNRFHHWMGWRYRIAYTNNAYRWIKALELSLYNFHSVPSLTGKGKEIILPQLISTDGKPVSSGSASDFSVIPSGAKVRTLANANIN